MSDSNKINENIISWKNGLIKIKEIYNKYKETDKLQNEAQTKHLLVFPFIETLGYDFEDVIPEYIADVGFKKGEKIDYAIKKNDKIIITIECKKIHENLDNHHDQLYRYFQNTNARISILTNGTEYRFFTDLKNNNQMDSKPFFTFNIFNTTDEALQRLIQFSKDNFNLKKIKADLMKDKIKEYLRDYIKRQLSDNPDDDFLDYMIKQSCKNRINNSNLDDETLKRFRPLVKDIILSLSKSSIKQNDSNDNEIVNNGDIAASPNFVIINNDNIPSNTQNNSNNESKYGRKYIKDRYSQLTLDLVDEFYNIAKNLYPSLKELSFSAGSYAGIFSNYVGTFSGDAMIKLDYNKNYIEVRAKFFRSDVNFVKEIFKGETIIYEEHNKIYQIKKYRSKQDIIKDRAIIETLIKKSYEYVNRQT